MRVIGLLKVSMVLAVDFVVLLMLLKDPLAASSIIAAIGFYIWIGGYISLFKEGAVRYDKLPVLDRQRLEMAKNQLTEDVKAASGINLKGLRLYLIPGDDDLQATAYGANCVSVSRGTLNTADPLSLNAVLAHESSHIIHFDPEFSRAVFASVTIVMAALSVMSFAMMAIIFLVFLALNCFKSWLGLLAFRGTTRLSGGLFGLIQRAIVMIYQTTLSMISRSAEYRCDAYSASLGYGLQLAHFLELAAPESGRKLTLTEALYRSHPPTEKRVYRLEEYTRTRMLTEHK